MDIAYDHIQESTYPEEQGDSSSSGEKKAAPQPSLNDDFQDAYRAFSSSPWGARIGGFFGTVVKQGGSVYREAQQELSAVGQDATRGFTDLRQSIIQRTRGLSLNTSAPPVLSPDQATREAGDNADKTPTATKDLSSEAALQESETVLSRLRGEAAKRLKDLQQAEDAADEALLRFGSNLRDFFRDAITIAPPSGDQADSSRANTGVLFESKDAHGKRVIHTSRFDAQLHVIHTSPESFGKDGTGAEFETWAKEFDIDKKTADISSDLEKYPELRSTMEKLVPDHVAYADFWKRYYFLRHGIETAEARRKDLLKAAAAEEEVGWDEDSDEEVKKKGEEESDEESDEEDDDSDEDSDEDDSDEESDDEADAGPKKRTGVPRRPGSTGSSATIQPSAAGQSSLKPSEPRKSNDEKSQADSEASYDVVGARSGVPSHAPNSPKEARGDKGESSDDSSDEEDWE
ncbi:hypothetical protein F5144DRAFT_98630 [Chaetomium tenue]|uniref:Uncharacterized protein n=1 Tax=Chaetomium tenue TaxID=1854479 RepID=A0ACB7PFD5_9PEZI|nr:hypothetical protein F5144DRAFT_98630 [Chaetomium globosum]